MRVSVDNEDSNQEAEKDDRPVDKEGQQVRKYNRGSGDMFVIHGLLWVLIDIDAIAKL